VVPYAERHLQQRVVSLRGQLQATLGRKPTLKELAAAGGLPVERVRQLLDMDAWQVRPWGGERFACRGGSRWLSWLHT
jgi:DNA-directed RNA polymerase specialized sigma subunit